MVTAMYLKKMYIVFKIFLITPTLSIGPRKLYTVLCSFTITKFTLIFNNVHCLYFCHEPFAYYYNI